jgi:hypothetical protein
MNISCILNAHSQPELIRDTLDSIFTFVTKKTLILIDGASWANFKNEHFDAPKIEGFYHNKPKSPYRNVALGLSVLSETFPESDWYCYCEPDVLFASERFKANLKMADEAGVWMLGNDGRISEEPLPLIQALIQEKFKSSYYLIGCCLFFNKKFIKKLLEINFFERFLTLTNSFESGYFPLYSGYDLSEHLYPTLCRHFGGNIGVFATYDHEGNWHGSYEYFPMRFCPEINHEIENFDNPSILHPIKNYDNPIRVTQREKRKKWKNLKIQENQ